MRTKEGTEIIAVSAADYVLVVIQNCTGRPWVPEVVGGEEKAAEAVKGE
jgi:hypothetical protein